MTPDPPEPPTPPAASFNLQCTTTSSASMVVVVRGVNGGNLEDLGRAKVSKTADPVDLGEIDLTYDSGSIKFYTKNYSSSYPDPNDSYYDNATEALTETIANMDGKSWRFTATGVGNGTLQEIV